MMNTTTVRRAVLPALAFIAGWAAACSSVAAADAVDTQAIHAIRDAGGIVVRDRQLPDHPVTLIRFIYKSADAKTLAQIAAFSELRELEFSATAITDADLRPLANLRRLRKLSMDLREGSITDTGIAMLAGFPGLEELDLVAWHVTDNGLKSLAGLTKLRVLRLACHSDGSGLAALKGLPNLQVLDLSGVKTSAALFRQIRTLPALRELELDCNGEVDDADLKLIAELPALEKLVLFSVSVGDDGLKALAGSRSLRSLYLRNNDITGAGIAALGRLQTLDELLLRFADANCLRQTAGIATLRSVGSNRATDATLHDLRALQHLRALDLSYSSITDAGLKELRDMADLEELDLSATKVTDAGMAELAGLKKLQTLTLVNGSIGDAGVRSLGPLTNLRELTLPGGVGDASLDVLARLPKLESLDLNCSNVSDATVDKLQQFPSLTALQIGTTKMTDVGLKSLARLTNLRELVLWSVSGQPQTYSDAAFQQLQDALPYTEVRRQ